MATDFVLDADTGYDPDELPPIAVKVDGREYTAYPPKDSLPILLSRLSDVETLERDPAAQQDLIRQILLSVFDSATTLLLLDRLMDMSDRKFSLRYVLHVVNLVGDHYRPLMQEHYEAMGVDNPLGTPANREERRALERGPAKKTVKKAAPRAAARAR